VVRRQPPNFVSGVQNSPRPEFLFCPKGTFERSFPDRKMSICRRYLFPWLKFFPLSHSCPFFFSGRRRRFVRSSSAFCSSSSPSFFRPFTIDFFSGYLHFPSFFCKLYSQMIGIRHSSPSVGQLVLRCRACFFLGFSLNRRPPRNSSLFLAKTFFFSPFARPSPSFLETSIDVPLSSLSLPYNYPSCRCIVCFFSGDAFLFFCVSRAGFLCCPFIL